jgi:GNAT superfamily N-acetyltransferase
MQFPADYHEEVVLSDGTRVSLRLIRPDDKARLLEILAALSTHSRTMRFFVARTHINEKELRYLTELDGVDHLALLALRGDESVGVARFVRQKPESDVAEPAIAVVDSLHARGLGRILLARLVAAARERGIERFEGEVLPQNRAMLRLLRGLGASVPPRPSPWAESMTFTLDLATAPPQAQRRVA